MRVSENFISASNQIAGWRSAFGRVHVGMRSPVVSQVELLMHGNQIKAMMGSSKFSLSPPLTAPKMRFSLKKREGTTTPSEGGEDVPQDAGVTKIEALYLVFGKGWKLIMLWR